MIRSFIVSQVSPLATAVLRRPHRTHRHLADSMLNSIGGKVGSSGSLNTSPPRVASELPVQPGADCDQPGNPRVPKGTAGVDVVSMSKVGGPMHQGDVVPESRISAVVLGNAWPSSVGRPGRLLAMSERGYGRPNIVFGTSDGK